jgi:hypothetical protein
MKQAQTRSETAIRGGKLSRIAVATVVALVVGFVVCGPAAAADPTRSEYVTQLESICKPRALATEQATKGTRTDINAERFDSAAKKFNRASQIFSATLDEISPIPRPGADTTRLAGWFSDLGQQERYLKQIVAQLRAGHAIKTQKLIARFIHSGNAANNAVLAFGFDYCSFKFSRFG